MYNTEITLLIVTFSSQGKILDKLRSLAQRQGEVPNEFIVPGLELIYFALATYLSEWKGLLNQAAYVTGPFFMFKGI